MLSFRPSIQTDELRPALLLTGAQIMTALLVIREPGFGAPGLCGVPVRPTGPVRRL
jgi:hypothetical protein